MKFRVAALLSFSLFNLSMIANASSGFPAGTAGSPGWAISGDADTGLFSPASNTISLSAGGVQGLRVNYTMGAVNYASIAPSESGSAVIYGVGGTDTNVDLMLSPKGTGSVLTNGNIGIKTSAADKAILNLGAGRASLAPLKFNPGTFVTTPVPGAVEYDGYQLYFTDASSVRHMLLNTDVMRDGFDTALDSSAFARLRAQAAPPFSCGFQTEGYLVATSRHILCMCDGAEGRWVNSADGTSDCRW